MDERLRLTAMHTLRMQMLWGPKVDMMRFPWPATEEEWRQTSHGAPWDTNVEMARDLLGLAAKAKELGLV